MKSIIKDFTTNKGTKYHEQNTNRISNSCSVRIFTFSKPALLSQSPDNCFAALTLSHHVTTQNIVDKKQNYRTHFFLRPAKATTPTPASAPSQHQHQHQHQRHHQHQHQRERHACTTQHVTRLGSGAQSRFELWEEQKLHQRVKKNK